jgi:hypothetical protein
MPSYLIVANQTLASPTLTAAVDERVAAGDARFHVVVPMTPTHGGLTWDEADARREAQHRLDHLLTRLREHGAEASGEIGAADPVDAAYDALRLHPCDEVLLSTLPPGISRWLHLDVPSRMRDAVKPPVVLLTATREPATAGA